MVVLVDDGLFVVEKRRGEESRDEEVVISGVCGK